MKGPPYSSGLKRYTENRLHILLRTLPGRIKDPESRRRTYAPGCAASQLWS